VIGPTGAVRVTVATKPVEFRKGAEGLAALVRETMAADPFSGAVYVFRAKRAQHATFCIQSSKRDNCISVASPFWTNASSRTVPTRQGFEVHLHGGAARV
jgi:transposase